LFLETENCFKITVFWDIVPCSLVESGRRFRDAYCLKIHKTIILPVDLYGCETWALILMEAHGLRVFEKRVLRRIFGPKKDDVTG
jgi:hypothetical protein